MPKVISNGIQMQYEDRGQGTPLILLMGLGAGGNLWEEHVQAYEQHFRCIIVDNRGAGGTSKPEGPYSTAMMAADTIGLMDALSITKAHISGISMGSAIAQQMALAVPDRMLSLTLNCSWSECSPYISSIFKVLSSSYSHLDGEAFQNLLQLFIHSPEFYEAGLEEFLLRQQVLFEPTEPMPLHAFLAQCDACLAHFTTKELGKIKTQTLITVGEQDIFTPVSLSNMILRGIPHAEFSIFKGCGHTHHWECLHKFNELTLDFMIRQEGNG